jgi:hypothetical protein
MAPGHGTGRAFVVMALGLAPERARARAVSEPPALGGRGSAARNLARVGEWPARADAGRSFAGIRPGPGGPGRGVAAWAGGGGSPSLRAMWSSSL